VRVGGGGIVISMRDCGSSFMVESITGSVGSISPFGSILFGIYMLIGLNLYLCVNSFVRFVFCTLL